MIKAQLFLFMILFFPKLSWGMNPYVKRAPGFMPVCDSSLIELKNLPPVLDQGERGLCYAHSSHLLLEHLRCSQTSNPKACYRDQGAILHLARFQTFDPKGIKNGGEAKEVLLNFQFSDRKLSKESCAPYETWKEIDKLFVAERKKLILPPDAKKNEYDFFYYLLAKLRKDSSFESQICWAEEITKAGILHNLSDLLEILSKANSSSWQELRYKILVPKKCLADPVVYPSYDRSYLSTYQKSFNEKMDFVFQHLSLGYPLEISFRSSVNPDQSSNLHSASIVGQRQVCNQSSCRYQLKIQNSFGKSWQESMDDGWVDAENLLSQADEPGRSMTAILPKNVRRDHSLKATLIKESPLKNKLKLISHGNQACWQV